MTLRDVMRVCPHLTETQAKDVFETAKKEARPVTYEVIGRVSEQLYG